MLYINGKVILCSLRNCGYLELNGPMKKNMGKRVTAPVKTELGLYSYLGFCEYVQIHLK